MNNILKSTLFSSCPSFKDFDLKQYTSQIFVNDDLSVIVFKNLHEEENQSYFSFNDNLTNVVYIKQSLDDETKINKIMTFLSTNRGSNSLVYYCLEPSNPNSKLYPVNVLLKLFKDQGRINAMIQKEYFYDNMSVYIPLKAKLNKCYVCGEETIINRQAQQYCLHCHIVNDYPLFQSLSDDCIKYIQTSFHKKKDNTDFSLHNILISISTYYQKKKHL